MSRQRHLLIRRIAKGHKVKRCKLILLHTTIVFLLVTISKLGARFFFVSPVLGPESSTRRTILNHGPLQSLRRPPPRRRHRYERRR